MAKTINFQNAVANYVKGMQGASAAYTAGVNAVTTSPGQAAAAQASKWMANLQASEGRWTAKMQNMSLQSWQNACTAKASRLGTGAAAAQPKLNAYYAQQGGQIQALANQIQASRATTTGEERSAAWMAGMKTIAASYKG